MKELKGTYSPLELEERVRGFWKDWRILEKVERAGVYKPRYRFLEGPPTTNGFMHIGHARGRAMKDVMLRYEAMRGKNVWRRAGWDCQGLPVEIEVEKKLGVSSKRDIEKIGLPKFIEECHKVVDFYINHWRSVSERLALWLDYDNAYETRRDEYIEFVWWFLKVAHEKGLLEEDYKVVPSCPRCETPLSSHEVALGYAPIRDPSIFVKFPVRNKPNEYLLIWTTTPWTLPGDEAVSVHPNFEYVKVRINGERWILAKELLERVMTHLKIATYAVEETLLGRDMEGLRYIHPLLEETPAHKQHIGHFDHAVICGEHVTAEEGTGCVHTAPAHGPEDFEMGKKYSLQIFCPVDSRGSFTEEAGKYSGKFVRDANDEIIQDLKKSHLLAFSEELEHEYPLCWRCDAPLIYRVDRQWFLRVNAIRERLTKENKKVVWFPEWAGASRFGEWIANAEDWCISRSRVWGSPLNIWRCDECQSVRVVGSRRELQQLAVKLPPSLQLHRPWIDEVRLRCESCSGSMQRVTFVLDCWLDSGVAHAASVGYLKDPTLFRELFPYDFVTEAVDQTRGWFYSLLVTSTIAFDSAPYRDVLCQGHVLDKFGQKMSKSKGNVVWAEQLLEKHGADLLRIYLLSKAAPGDALVFDEDELEQVKRLLMIVWNVFTFSTTYMTLDKFDPTAHTLQSIQRALRFEDKWLLSRSQAVVNEISTALDSYRFHKAARALLDFAVEDISRLYIRLIRRRTWIESEKEEKTAAYYALNYALATFVRLMAPFAPHLAEELHQSIRDEHSPESVHLQPWPTVDEALRSETVESDMDACREAVRATSAARQKSRLKLRWPVKNVTIQPLTSQSQQSLRRTMDTLMAQVNAKEVTILRVGEKPPFIRSVINAKHAQLGRKFRSLAPKIAAALSTMDANEVMRSLSAEGFLEVEVEGGKHRVTADMVEVKEILPDYITSEVCASGIVFVDITRTPEVLSESVAREIVRRAQIMRKGMQLKIEEHVDVDIQPGDMETYEITRALKEYIVSEVRIRNLRIMKPGEVLPAEEKTHPAGFLLRRQWDLEGETVTIVLRKDT